MSTVASFGDADTPTPRTSLCIRLLGSGGFGVGRLGVGHIAMSEHRKNVFADVLKLDRTV